jgi:hypothetical protein
MSVRILPSRPDLEQLRHQAKDLLRDFRAGNPPAVADFHEFGEQPVDEQRVKLADASLVIARSYGAPSWPRLAAVCRLIDTLWHDDRWRRDTTVLHEALRTVLEAYPLLADDYAASPDTGWRPAMSAAANHALRRIVENLQERGARDVDETMARPELRDQLDMLRALGRLGARFPKDAIGGAVESLSGSNFAFMVEMGTAIEDERHDWRSRVGLALETYARHPAGKHRILETMVARGVPLPDSPPLAVHRGRIDLLEALLRRDPAMLQRTFSHREIFPPEIGCHEDERLALVGAPIAGATLLHMATDYEELDVVRWLLDQGMDPNVRAETDGDGFGGHTALFNCVISYNAGRRDDRIVRLLLERGAAAGIRASIRKGVTFARDDSVHEYRNVTPLEWGRQFHDQSYVVGTTMRALEEWEASSVAGSTP